MQNIKEILNKDITESTWGEIGVTSSIGIVSGIILGYGVFCVLRFFLF